MNEILTQLVSLQAIDLEIDQIDNAIKSEQSALDERMSALANREALINELQEKIISPFDPGCLADVVDRAAAALD